LEETFDFRVGSDAGSGSENGLQMAAADEDLVRNPNLMRPAALVSAGETDWSGPTRFQAIHVIPRLLKKEIHG
jgi:hypothetical protein